MAPSQDGLSPIPVASARSCTPGVRALGRHGGLAALAVRGPRSCRCPGALPAPRSSFPSRRLSAVDVAAVADGEHQNEQGVVMDLVDDPVLARPHAPLT